MGELNDSLDSVLEGRTILLVEDEFLILMDLQMQLEDAGATVIAASSVSDGLARAGRGAVDAAVLDVRLPDGEVYPVALALRDRAVPFLFHSGHAHRNEVQRLFPGAPALAKPVAEKVFLRAVEGLLS